MIKNKSQNPIKKKWIFGNISAPKYLIFGCSRDAVILVSKNMSFRENPKITFFGYKKFPGIPGFPRIPRNSYEIWRNKPGFPKDFFFVSRKSIIKGGSGGRQTPLRILAGLESLSDSINRGPPKILRILEKFPRFPRKNIEIRLISYDFLGIPMEF